MGLVFEDDPEDRKQWLANLRFNVEQRIAEAEDDEVVLPLDAVIELLRRYKPPTKVVPSHRDSIIEMYRQRFRRRVVVGGEARKRVLHEEAERAAIQLAKYKDSLGRNLFPRLSVTTLKRLIESDKPPGQKKKRARPLVPGSAS
ncbi:hypothetical protein [Bradyrhizobium yuanmingense]|uniref:hypothetical protein n=1 Tax=Bradyrhizobium yuanmingense TaxID=108015 RepID=UPI0023B9F6E3|nr:hypothetical protein [Bradyrhizobium yuanmingense]MDF0583303.1 hypothetical protein [Bradyrhizobium yuanmingense]